MIFSDATLTRRLEPFLKRVLVVEPTVVGARLLTDLLKMANAKQIYTDQTSDAALATCRLLEPQIIFTDLTGPGLDGLAFVRELRRSELNCRQAPIIVVTAQATTSAIVAARNAGVHEFLRKPFTMGDVTRRLEAVTLKPRDWIEAVDYIGPDRRRFNSGDYQGPRKRQSDEAPMSAAEKLQQTLQIAKAAIAALDSDPSQALRSLSVQATELKSLGPAVEQPIITAAAVELQTVLASASVQVGLDREAIETAAAGLWAFLRADDPPPDARAVA